MKRMDGQHDARGNPSTSPTLDDDQPIDVIKTVDSLPAILHIISNGHWVFLWGETQSDGRVDQGVHPGCVSPRDLSLRLARADLRSVYRQRKLPFATFASMYTELDLPTVDGRPLPSPGLGSVATWTGRMQSWEIHGIAHPIWDSVPWFAPFAPRSGDDLRLGTEWLYWWRLAAIVRGMVRRGSFAPTLIHENGQVSAGWRAVPGRSEREAMGSLCEAMPTVGYGGHLAREEVVENFLLFFGDALVRSSTGRAPVLAELRRETWRASVSETWLAHLVQRDRHPLPPSSRRRNWDRVRAWLMDPARLTGPARVVLQINEPTAEDPEWTISMYVELPEEPGVLVPADEVWAEGDARPDGSFQKSRVNLEGMIASLGDVMPTLATALRQRSRMLSVTIDEVWALVNTHAKKLQAAGVEVLVPKHWRPPIRPSLRMHTEGPGLFGADTLVRFEWEIAIGDETLSVDEFERLVAQRLPLVKLRRGWVALERRDVEALRARWEAHGGKGEAGLGSALLMAVEAEATEDETAASVALDGMLQDALQRLAASAQEEAAEPEGFHGHLRPYQRRGLGWIAARAGLGLGGILADDMGLGKTVQVLAALARRRQEGISKPSLVVAPTSVVSNWATEASHFTPDLRVLVHHGASRARGSDVAAQAARVDVVVTSYAILQRDTESLQTIPWDGVILDEAQNVKNAAAKQAQAARRLRSNWRLALTGTPIENSLGDLWSIFAFCQPGYLHSAEAFRAKLASRIERDHDPMAEQTLKRLVGPLVLRRTKNDPGIADELPPKIETVEHCVLTREQAALYEAVARNLMERIEDADGMARRAAVLLALLRLKQVCNHPAHFTGDDRPLSGRSGKLNRLEELLEEVVAEGGRSLIFTQFATFGRRLVSHLTQRFPQCPIFHLDGSTPSSERPAIVRHFQESEGPAVFVLSLKAGGAGLNLTAAHHVFHFDRWWNPAVERQATDRAHRIGQNHTVQVHKFVCAGTLEERIDELIRSKEALADGFFGSGEAWLTELDDRALREILTLRRTALGIETGGGIARQR